jgi:FRG domain
MSSPLPGIVIGSWSQLSDQLNQLVIGEAPVPRYLFRGQANAAWALESKLRRLLRLHLRQDVEAIEERLIEHFTSHAPVLAPAIRDQLERCNSRLETWSLMQHFGTPTRLIDWSESALVAAYFACVDGVESDGALFVADPSVVNEHYGIDDDALNSDGAPAAPAREDTLCLFFPEVLSERHIAQLGAFSYTPDPSADQETLLAAAMPPGTPASGRGMVVSKWTIRADAKADILYQLRYANVAAHALFPGADGLGRSEAEMVILMAEHGVNAV